MKNNKNKYSRKTFENATYKFTKHGMLQVTSRNKV